MKCNKCQRPMHKVDRRDELVQLDEDVTDGQMADYLAAEYSGNHGAWNLGIVEYFCHKCNLYTQVVNDELPDYYPLIQAWHEKAAEGDTFSRFVFQYLAFIAHIKNHLFFEAPSDRIAIQRLKREDRIGHTYLKAVAGNEDLHQIWSEVIIELERRPLHNSSTDPTTLKSINGGIVQKMIRIEIVIYRRAECCLSRIGRTWSNIGIALGITSSTEEKIPILAVTLFL